MSKISKTKESGKAIKHEIAKAGKLICVDGGEYSDYRIYGFFVVLKDFDPYEELEEYLKEHPEQREDYHFKEDGLLAALLRKGLLMEVKYGTIHLTDFACSNAFYFRA